MLLARSDVAHRAKALLERLWGDGWHQVALRLGQRAAQARLAWDVLGKLCTQRLHLCMHSWRWSACVQSKHHIRRSSHFMTLCSLDTHFFQDVPCMCD